MPLFCNAFIAQDGKNLFYRPTSYKKANKHAKNYDKEYFMPAIVVYHKGLSLMFTRVTSLGRIVKEITSKT